MIIDDDKSIKDGAVIVVPGHKERHHTIINVPGADGKVSARVMPGLRLASVCPGPPGRRMFLQGVLTFEPLNPCEASAVAGQLLLPCSRDVCCAGWVSPDAF